MFLKITDLNKSWNGFSLKNISLEIEEARYFVFLGPCGAGKTLLLNGLSGLYCLDSGKIFLQEKEITYLPAEKRNIGYLFQKDALFPHLSVKENIYYGLKRARQDPKHLESIFELLDIKDLLSRRDTINLSGGQMRKVALARSLAVKPRLLLLDEPMSFLDPVSQQKVKESLSALNKKMGLTIIHVTHDIREIKDTADRIAVLLDGAVAQVGSVDEILNHPPEILREKFWGKT